MSGTTAVTRNIVKTKYEGKAVEKIEIAWTSTAGGAATVAIEKLHGYIVKLVTDPDGTDAPTANYDITLVDEHGADALAGAGIDRHTSTTEVVYPKGTNAVVPVFIAGTATFTVAAAGNAKSGVATLYIVESLLILA
jgi:hypothetical protein